MNIHNIMEGIVANVKYEPGFDVSHLDDWVILECDKHKFIHRGKYWHLISRINSHIIIDSCNLFTDNDYMLAFEHSVHLIRFIPHHLITYKMASIAVKCSGFNLQYLPEELQTVVLCYDAVSKDGCALVHVKNKNYNICEFALYSDIKTFSYIPDEFKPRLYDFAISIDKNIQIFAKN